MNALLQYPHLAPQPALVVDLEAARRYLRTLDPGTREFTFQTFDDLKTRKETTLAQTLHGTIDDLAPTLARLNRRGAGVYVTVNRTVNGSRRKEDIIEARAMFREADSPDLPIIPIEPHLVVETSPGKKHEYFLLEPNSDFETWEGILETVVAEYGGDPGAKGRNRVLRLPGFYHMKDPDHPHMVKVVHESGTPRLALDELAKVFPPTRRNGAPADLELKQPRVHACEMSAYAMAALDGEVEKVRTAPEGLRNDTLNRAAFSIGQLVAGGEIDGTTATTALHDAATAAGLPGAEASRTILSGLDGGSKEPRQVPAKKTAQDQDEMPESQPELMTAAECQIDSNLSLEVPEHVLDPGGLISLGMSALSAPGMSRIPQYNLPVILTTIANAIAGTVVFRGVYPNLYNVKIGPTSTGKSEGDKAMVRAIREHIAEFYGPSDFASGPALLRALADNPRCMIVIDEGTSLFRRSGKADTVADGKRDALLELYSASGGIIEKAYSDKKNNIVIDTPCFSLTANATPALFESIEHQDFISGILQRFDFWCYDGPAPRRTRASTDNTALRAFANGIAAIRTAVPNSTHGNMVGVIPAPVALEIDRQADDRLQQWSDTVVDRVNAVDDDGLRGIISRSYDLAIKYAMTHLAATRLTSGDLVLSIADIEYGIAVAWMLADWKINRLRNRITCGDFDRDCELFKEAVRRAVAKGRRPTLKVLVDRCRQMKNFPSTYLEQITRTLVSRGEVVADTSMRPTVYNLVRQ